MTKARAKSESGFYHVVARGNSRMTIFEDEDDHRVFLRFLFKCAHAYETEVHAYCLMPNHYHLLVRDTDNRLGDFAGNLDAAYTRYFNGKYDRVGSLFQGRFSSECVNDDAYFLTVFRYILQNPAKAGLAAVDSYPWSSFAAYGKAEGSVETHFALEMLGGVDRLRAFVVAPAAEIDCLEAFPRRRLTDTALRRFIEEELALRATEVTSLPKAERDSVLRRMRSEGFSVRRIERVTGVSRGVIQSV